MLEVKNLTKIYKTKGGTEVRALDDVSISFEDKGMVFLLGRSGSGKSTLLNMCGGLDAPDSGEIIVKGRSSKDFSAGDFDSYRNTYVGFIFQEYNILNEFSVEDNIALALELQGRPKDKETIAKLLEEVELTNFAKRKPNTLSGGQKQRVAIARALVKNPEIIMADEPTGALDSNTGKQVFDTLKKLSENKLVIVVSHDREFAEEYGDRIIELKDGKVISDVVKDSVAPVIKDENVCLLGDNTIFIKKGSKLSAQDFTKIKKFVAECDDDVLISKDKQDITDYKKAAKINDDNSKELFCDIKSQPEQKSYSSEDNKFIRSKLPLRHAIKIGASGIKVKPFRFTFTVLLSVISFILFGLFSCLMFYDAKEVQVNSLKEAGVEYLDLHKSYDSVTYNYEVGRDEPWTYTQTHSANMSDADINEIKDNFGDKMIPVYKLNGCEIDNLSLNNLTQSLYVNNVYGFVPANAPLEYTAGSAPSGENQIALSQYLFDAVRSGELKDDDLKEIRVETYSDAKIRINGKIYTVSGIFKSENIPLKYNTLDKTLDTSGRWTETLRSGFYSYIAIDPAHFETFAKNVGYEYNSVINSTAGGTFGVFCYSLNSNRPVVSNLFSKLQNVNYFDNTTATVAASGNEVMSAVVNSKIYFNVLQEVADIYANRSGDEYKPDFASEYLTNPVFQDELLDLVDNAFGSQEEMLSAAKKVLDVTNKYFTLDKLSIKMRNFAGDQLFADGISLKGFYFNPSNDFSDNVTYMSSDLMQIYKEKCLSTGSYVEVVTNYKPQNYEQNNYSHVFVGTNGNTHQIRNLLEYRTNADDNGEKYTVVNGLITEIGFYNAMVDVLSKVFLWIGIILAIFSMLLLFNFITASISAKKKEIGILRAVGARGTDVFKIFFSESFIVVALCIILSIIFTGVFAGLINDSVSNQIGIPFPMFTFGIVSVVMIIAIALVSAVISTFFPVYGSARKKPVESIRSL